MPIQDVDHRGGQCALTVLLMAVLAYKLGRHCLSSILVPPATNQVVLPSTGEDIIKLGSREGCYLLQPPFHPLNPTKHDSTFEKKR